MPLPENSAAANLQLLQKFLTEHTNQQALLQKWLTSGKGHQLAICFTFPADFQIDLKKVKQNTSYGERVMRLCESVNQPDTIKADIWTRSTNNGTLAGVRPGIPVTGEPIPPEEFLGQLDYTLVSFVFPGPKFGGEKFKLVTPDVLWGAKAQAFAEQVATAAKIDLAQMGDVLHAANAKKPSKPKKPKITEENKSEGE